MNRDTCNPCGAPSELCADLQGADLEERLHYERSGVPRLHEADVDTEYELIGTIDGTYAGRWMLAAFAENAAAVWPDGTAVYVRRGQV